jgi:hypothetical protein
MRTTLIQVSLILTVAALNAFGADNTLGAWKLNVEKSKYTPAPMPVKSLNITREASDGGLKQTTTGERADGTAINGSYTAKYDGKDVPVTGTTPYNTIAIKQINANTQTEERKNSGNLYKATMRTVISNGGKIMTATGKGTEPNGKEFTLVFIFDKQ